MDIAGIKASTDELVAQLPAIEAFLDDQRAKFAKTFSDGAALMQATIKEALATGQQTVGESLAAVTAERTEIVNDLHGIIDRFQILPRKDPLA